MERAQLDETQKKQASRLRQDYLRYCAEAEKFQGRNEFEGFLDKRFDGNPRAKELRTRRETLVRRAMAFASEVPELTGRSILEQDYWQVLGYRQV